MSSRYLLKMGSNARRKHGFESRWGYNLEIGRFSGAGFQYCRREAQKPTNSALTAPDCAVVGAGNRVT